MFTHRRVLTAFLLLLLPSLAAGEPATIVNYQGKVEHEGNPFSETGYFKFAIVDATGSTTLWSSSGMSGTEPEDAVALNVERGIFSVGLGDTSHPNMASLPSSVFESDDTWLRIWFSLTNSSFVCLLPDQKITGVAYAVVASTAERLGTSVDYSTQAHDADPYTSGTGLLPRESVWPEHYGRGNTIYSSQVSYNRTSYLDSTRVFTVPAGKKFILTDIVYWSAGQLTLWSYSANGSKELFKCPGTGDSRSYSLRAGIPVDQQSVIYAYTEAAATPNLFISGFQITSSDTPTSLTFVDHFLNAQFDNPPWSVLGGGPFKNGVYLNPNGILQTMTPEGWTDMELRCRVLFTTPGTGQTNFYLREHNSDIADDNIRVLMDFNLLQIKNGTTLLSSLPIAFPIDTWFDVKILLIGDNVKVWANNAGPTPDLDVAVPSPTHGGEVALSASGPDLVHLDDLMIEPK